MQDRAVIGVIQFFHDLLYLFSRFQIVGDPSLLLLLALYDLPQQPLGIFGGNRKFFDLLCQFLQPQQLFLHTSDHLSRPIGPIQIPSYFRFRHL